jgi:hypothetical protein
VRGQHLANSTVSNEALDGCTATAPYNNERTPKTWHEHTGSRPMANDTCCAEARFSKPIYGA